MTEPAITAEAATDAETSTPSSARNTSFGDFGLHEALLLGIYSFGLERPSPVQQRAIGPITEQRDCIIQSPGSCGNTTAVVICALQSVIPSSNTVQIIILQYSREKISQCAMYANAFGAYARIHCVDSAAGKSIRDDAARLALGAHIVVASPGRLMELVNKKALSVSTVRMIILNDLDELISKGFQSQLTEVIRILPEKVQLVMTIHKGLKDGQEIAKAFKRTPVLIHLEKKEFTLDMVKHFSVGVSSVERKLPVLLDLCKTLAFPRAVIFLNATAKVQTLVHEMRANGLNVFSWDDCTNSSRNNMLQRYNTTKRAVLVTTELFPHGVDMKDVPFIVNYDMPTSKEAYIHRIVVVGERAKKSVAVNLTDPGDADILNEIREHYGLRIPEMPLDASDFF